MSTDDRVNDLTSFSFADLAKSANSFADGARGGPGFSLRFAGASLGLRAEGWTIERQTDDAVQYGHADGLTVIREVRRISAQDAFEVRVRVRNDTSKTLSPFESLNFLDVAFGCAPDDDISVISSRGGLADSVYPPRNWSVTEHRLSRFSGFPASLEFGAGGGRSSNKDLPFLLLNNDRHHDGLFLAIEWSGDWAVALLADRDSVMLKAKIPGLKIALSPGEEIRAPAVLIGFYRGDSEAGANALRRLIRDVYMPKLAGRDMHPIATYDTWFGVDLDFDATLLRDLASAAADLGQEYFLLDAGWYAGTQGHLNFGPGVGNWFDIDTAKLPEGIEPVAEHVRECGMKFGLWFEPERVAEGTRLAREHPDWILWDHGEPSESWWQDIYPDYFDHAYGLLNFGLPEVQDWVVEMIAHHIERTGAEYIRYDFNIDPLPYWQAADDHDRRGITQFRHIEGLYSVIERLSKRYPQVVLEGCAAGGLRIDLGVLRRFHTLLISDSNSDPALARYHLLGANIFLPGSYLYVLQTRPTRSQAGYVPTALDFQSMFGGAFGLGGRLDTWPTEQREQALRHVQVWKRLRRYLNMDFYALCGQPSDPGAPSAWQFHDANDRSGFVQTFNPGSRLETGSVVLRAMERGSRYEFSDPYSGERFELEGSVVLDQGVPLNREPGTSAVLIYRCLDAPTAA